MSKRILLTSGRHPVTLHLARLLHAAGHKAYVTDTSKWQLCRFSSSVTETFVVPAPRSEPQAHSEELIKIIETNKIDWLIPTCEDILFISQNLEEFPCQVLCDPFPLIHNLHHKWKFQNLVESAGLESLESHLICSEKELKTLPADQSYIVKPCYSRAAQGLSKVFPGSPLPKLDYPANNPWIAQRFLVGSKYCLYAVAHKGQVTAESIYPVQYAIDDSSCVYFEAIRHAGIEEWVRTFCQAHSITGQISFDFIELNDGSLYAIECNPRSTSGAHLFRYCDGLDKALLNTQDSACRPTTTWVRQIRAGMALYGWKGLKGREAIQKFLKSLWATQDVLYEPEDPWPAVIQPLLFGKYVKDSLKYRIPLPAAFTFDLDWDASQLK